MKDERDSLESSPSFPTAGRGYDGKQPSEPTGRHHTGCARQRILRGLFLALSTMFTVWACTQLISPHLPSWMTASHHNTGMASPDGTSQGLAPWVQETQKVSLEAHVMSKCPDARACLQNLVVPAMEMLEDRVEFELSFIGASSQDPNSDVVVCKHGPEECLGNIILLCAAKLYPEPRLSLGFANCLIDDFEDIPRRALVEACAMEQGLNFQMINECISDAGAAQSMLRDSVERSSKADIHTSCTIRLQQKIWCVTGDPRDCNDGGNLDALVRDIETEHDKLNS